MKAGFLTNLNFTKNAAFFLITFSLLRIGSLSADDLTPQEIGTSGCSGFTCNLYETQVYTFPENNPQTVTEYSTANAHYQTLNLKNPGVYYGLVTDASGAYSDVLKAVIALLDVGTKDHPDYVPFLTNLELYSNDFPGALVVVKNPKDGSPIVLADLPSFNTVLAAALAANNPIGDPIAEIPGDPAFPTFTVSTIQGNLAIVIHSTAEAAVPEPGTWMLVGTSLLGVGLFKMRKLRA